MKLTDLEITKACAEVSEVWKIAHEWYPTMTLDATFKGIEERNGQIYLIPNNAFRQEPRHYDPLHDDAQAMALVKKFKLNIGQLSSGYAKVFTGFLSEGFSQAESKNLNRAICECVAHLETQP